MQELTLEELMEIHQALLQYYADTLSDSHFNTKLMDKIVIWIENRISDL